MKIKVKSPFIDVDIYEAIQPPQHPFELELKRSSARPGYSYWRVHSNYDTYADGYVEYGYEHEAQVYLDLVKARWG